LLFTSRDTHLYSMKKPSQSDISLPMSQYLINMMAAAKINNRQLAEALGYTSANVIAMLRNGTMALPIDKLIPAARALGVDEIFFLIKGISEKNPTLATALKETLGDRLISKKELALVEFCRTHLDGVDADLLDPELLALMKPRLTAMRESELIKHQLTTELLRKEDARSGPKPGRRGLEAIN
jgi:transcriptional regulator with XRE-family HTH domain